MKQKPLLHPNACVHVLATAKNGTNLKLDTCDTHVTPMCCVGIFIKQTAALGRREEIDMQINFCVIVEITDTMLDHKIYLLCKTDLQQSTSPKNWPRPQNSQKIISPMGSKSSL